VTTARTLVSRFELRARPDADLAVIEHEVRTDALAAGLREVEIRPVQQSASLMIRLQGPGPAVARVRDRAGRVGQVLRDSLVDAEPGTMGPAYPDPVVSARISPQGLEASGTHKPGSYPVTVAIVDSGVMIDHPELSDHLWTGDGMIHGASFLGDDVIDPDVTDRDGHGTMLAGTVLAAAGRRGVRLMAVKFWDARHVPRAANAARAIEFASRNGAGVIDLSFDLGLGSDDLRDAIVGACDAGALVVIAAGNDGHDNDRIPSVPSCYAALRPERTITVMATNRDDEKAPTSNYGRTTVDLAAPGVWVVSTYPFVSRGPADVRRRYRAYTGTSAAAAHVAGAAALLRSADPSLTPEDVKRRLLASVDQRAGLRCVSSGRLNIDRALSGYE
jgi:subtilisin family serine protease